MDACGVPGWNCREGSEAADMTVYELIEKLKKMPQKATVVYGMERDEVMEVFEPNDLDREVVIV